MPVFSVCTLASSSKGNCVYVRLGDDELLIDAGISCKRICDTLRSLDSDISRIKAIFITHEHSDHVSGLETISKKYKIPIHMTEPSAISHLRSKNTEHTAACTVRHPLLFCETVGSLTVSSFVTSHDSSASVGYTVTDGTAEHTFAIATDLGCVTDEVCDALLGVPSVILESNHDENMLLCGPYPYELKRRILSNRGHLSNEAAASLVSRLAAAGTKRILLAHLSEENNLPELAYHSALEALGGREIFVDVAAPASPTRLI